MVSSKEISEMLAAKREGKLPKKDENNKKVIKKKKCPECGMENKKEAKFCVGCGKNFEEKTVQIKPKDIKEESNTKICPSCKSEIPESAKFCVVCGETQSDTTEEPILEKVEIKQVIEAEKTSSKLSEAPNLVIRELILNEDGLKFNENMVIEGLNEENKLIKYEEIDNIEFKDEAGLKTIEIETLDSKIKIKGVEPDLGPEFVSKTREMIKEVKPEIDTESMDKIKKAEELLEIGAISKEEFEKIKQKILEKS